MEYVTAHHAVKISDDLNTYERRFTGIDPSLNVVLNFFEEQYRSLDRDR